MYGMVNTYKVDNSVRAITYGCNNAVENLSFLVDKTINPIANKLPSKIKNANDMICVKGSTNNSFSTDDHVLVSFNVVNMFPNIDNEIALQSVKAVF